jgi:general secretion pathway protein I
MRRVAEAREEAMGAENGFALVEVIVAFAILSLTLIVLYQGAGEQARSARHIAAKTEGLAIAQSLLASVGYDLPLLNGVQHGRTPGGYHWALDISPYTSQQSGQSNPLKGYWVEVSVAGDQSGVSLIVLRTIKLGLSDG